MRRVDLEAFAVTDLVEADSCSRRRAALDMLRRHARTPAALEAVREARSRDDGCLRLLLDLSSPRSRPASRGQHGDEGHRETPRRPVGERRSNTDDRAMTVDGSDDESGFIGELTVADRASTRWRVSVDGVPAVPATLVFDLPIVIGRDAACDVVVKHTSVSRQHLRLVPSPGGVIVQHTATTNGFLLNGVKHTEQATAQDGDAIQIGAATARLSVVDANA